MRHSTRNFRPALEILEARALLSAAPGLSNYVQTNLVSNIRGVALITDPNLVNPWDVNFPQQTGINPPVYVADQGSGMVSAYQISPDGGGDQRGGLGGDGPQGRLQRTERPYRLGPKYAPRGILDPRARWHPSSRQLHL